MNTRTKLPTDVKQLVLHEGGYKCGNPVCRTMLTLDIHHLVPVSSGGSSEPSNLLALCPNCHALHHRGTISEASIRSWKMLLLAINEAFDRKAIDTLLALHHLGHIQVSGDAVLQAGALVAQGLLRADMMPLAAGGGYYVVLSERGKLFVDAWIAGDQNAVVQLPR